MSDFGSAFSSKFLANRNATSNKQTAPTIKSNVHGDATSPDDVSQLKQDVLHLKRQVQDIHAQMGIFGQQLASVKPNIVHAKDYDSARFNAWLEQLLQEQDSMVVVGATWCPHCTHQKEELEKLPSGTKSYVIYIDDDQKLVPAFRALGMEIMGLPTLFKTLGNGKLKELAVGFTKVDELSAHL
jgi:thiol-disulfide isomerase/thioredoxin